MNIINDRYINISDICWTLPQTSPVCPPKCLNAIDVTNRDAKTPEVIMKRNPKNPNVGITSIDKINIDNE